MKRIGDSTNTANASGEWSEGNPAAGLPATLLKADWLTTLQREVVNVILGAGISLDKEDDSQLLKAIQAIQAAASTWAKLAGKPTTVSGFGITDAFTKTETGSAIQTAISALVASSPAALDTLKELATALGNDPNFATTMTNALAGKAAKATTLGGYNIGDAFTKLETSAAIQQAIAALVASSPAALDTLNELATALGNDPNFATTMTNALALKAPLANAALTGAPTAPTAALGTANLQLANTLFVLNTLNALLSDPWAFQPIGVPIPAMWGTGEPPTNKSYRYIKLTAADPYNTGVLTGEVVTGVAPMVVAYARISAANSSINGNTIYLLNTERRSVRPGMAGSIQDDAVQNITGKLATGLPTFNGVSAEGALGFSPPPASSQTGVTGGGVNGLIDLTFDASRVARTSNETRFKNIGATHYVRIY